MKIQFATILKDRHGIDMTEVDQETSKVGHPPVMKAIRLADVCVAVLDFPFQDDANGGIKPLMRRSELIERITAAEKSVTPLDMLDADLDYIKERLAKRNYPVQLAAAAVRLLEKDLGEKKATKAA